MMRKHTYNILHYPFDNDISVEIARDGDSCRVTIRDDGKDASVAFDATVKSLRDLADFINEYVSKD